MAENLSDEMCKEILKSGINRILDDSRKMISRSDLWVYGESNWPVIISSIKEWESRGLLKILKNPEKTRDMDICVEMLKYIDHTPKEGWPS